jgi:hypothetical protein
VRIKYPNAWYNKLAREWCLYIAEQEPWRDDTGAIRYFLTAQLAYDAHAAEVVALKAALA